MGAVTLARVPKWTVRLEWPLCAEGVQGGCRRPSGGMEEGSPPEAARAAFRPGLAFWAVVLL